MTTKPHDEEQLVVPHRPEIERLAALLEGLLRLGPYTVQDIKQAVRLLRDRHRA